MDPGTVAGKADAPSAQVGNIDSMVNGDSADIEANKPRNDEIEEREENLPIRIVNPIRNEDGYKSIEKVVTHIERRATDGLGEIHFLGEILCAFGASGDSSYGVMVRWNVDAPTTWQILGGDSKGQTQVSYYHPVVGAAHPVPLNHPIDLHYGQTGLHGWGAPRICVQTYEMDQYGLKIMNGYGFTHLPSVTGFYKLEINLWRPVGRESIELANLFLGKTPAVQDERVIYDDAWNERCRLVTMAAGKVFLHLYVIERSPDLDKAGLVHIQSY